MSACYGGEKKGTLQFTEIWQVRFFHVGPSTHMRCIFIPFLSTVRLFFAVLFFSAACTQLLIQWNSHPAREI